jgi:hypothetical protein
MQQWWDALDHLTAILHDADALGLTREARDRLVAAIGAFDRAMITCASLECPVRLAYQAQPPATIDAPRAKA